MANRNFPSGGKIYSMHVMPVIIDSTILIGAAGAVALAKGGGVLSVVHVSTGIYKIKCQPATNFNRLFHAHGAMQSPPTGLSGVLAIEIQNAPDVSVQTLSGAELTIKTLDAAGALVDPAAGSTISVMMLLSNSSVIIAGE